jgi:hypothetical protein
MNESYYYAARTWREDKRAVHDLIGWCWVLWVDDLRLGAYRTEEEAWAAASEHQAGQWPALAIELAKLANAR